MDLFLGFLLVPLVSISVLCQYHTVLMTVALQYNLKSGKLIPPAPFFFLKTALGIQGLLHLHMNCEISLKSLQTINPGEGVEKRECFCTVGGNVNWYSHYGRQYVDSFKKLGIKPPCDPAISLLGIYPEETKIERDTCILLFITLFTIARTLHYLQ